MYPNWDFWSEKKYPATLVSALDRQLRYLGAHLKKPVGGPQQLLESG
jgi:hypothetical protein